MNNDELLQLAEMFDTIVNSNNPAVQRSLHHTMLLATLAEERETSVAGPFARIFGAVKILEEEVRSLRRSVQILENSPRKEPYYDYSNMNTGMGALTTAQITALTADSVSLGSITLTPVSAIDMNSWNLDNNINIIKLDNGTT